MRKQVVVPVRRPAGPPRRRRPPARSPECSPWSRRWSSSLSMTPSRSWTSSAAPSRTRPSASRPASSLLTRCRSCSSCRSVRSSRSSRNLVARRSSTDSRAAALDRGQDLLALGLRVARPGTRVRPGSGPAGSGSRARGGWTGRWRRASPPRRRSAGSGRSFQHPEPVAQLGGQLEVLGLDREAELLPQLEPLAAARPARRRPGSA